MKKGDLTVETLFKVILAVVAATAAVLIIVLLKGKGEDLLNEMRSIFLGG